MSETFDEQLSRVDLMASGDSTWDLSENDCAALRAVILELRIISRAFLALRGEWISVKRRTPVTGALCWIVWAETVQTTAYRRVGLGFACEFGYVWDAAHGEVDSIPDNEVTHWMAVPNPPVGEDSEWVRNLIAKEPAREEGKHRFLGGTCVDCGHPLDEICTANLDLKRGMEQE
jgi:uncharacterized protein DUF551